MVLFSPRGWGGAGLEFWPGGGFFGGVVGRLSSFPRSGDRPSSDRNGSLSPARPPSFRSAFLFLPHPDRFAPRTNWDSGALVGGFGRTDWAWVGAPVAFEWGMV